MLKCVADDRPSAHRLPDQHRSVDLQMVEQGAEIARVRAIEQALGIGREAKAALIERDAFERSHEVGDLLPP